MKHSGKRNGVYAQILRKSSWNAIATILYRGVLLISMMLTARIIGKTEFGVLGIIQSSITLFESVSIFGMSTTAAKHVAEYRVNAVEKIHRIVSLTNVSGIVTGAIFSVLLYYSAPWMASEYLNNRGLVNYLRIASLIVGFNTLNSIQSGILIGFEAFKTIALINLILGIITITCVVSGAFWLGLVGALYGLLAVSVSAVIINTVCVFKILKKENIANKFEIKKQDLRLLLSFSIPSMLAGLMYAPINWLGASMLVNQPSGYASMGVFNAANQWFSVLLFIPGVVSNTLLPSFSSKFGSDDMKSLRQTIWQATKLLLIIVTPMSIIVAIASPIIMKIYGQGYDDGALVLTSIAVAAAFASIQNMLGYALASINRMWLHTLSNALWAVVYLACVHYFISCGFGALALSSAIAIAYMVKLILSGILVAIHTKSQTLISL